MKAHSLVTATLWGLISEAITTQNPALLENAYKKVKGNVLKNTKKELPEHYETSLESTLLAHYHLYIVRCKTDAESVKEYLETVAEEFAMISLTHSGEIQNDQLCPGCVLKILLEKCSFLANGRPVHRDPFEMLFGGGIGGGVLTVIELGGR